MRRSALTGLLSLVVPMAIALSSPASADFDPSGRGRKPPPKPAPKPGTSRPVARPGADAQAGKAPAADVLIARYTAIVMSQPSAPFPIQRLAQLYRERDGDLKKLVVDFEQRAAQTGPDAWPAKVALAGIYRQDGRYDDAIRTYESAIAEKPGETAALLALAQLEADRGDKAKARARYEAALSLLKVAADVEQTTRTLLGLCLDLSDWDAAKRYHDALVKAGGGSLFIKAELGRELYARGAYERAEAELRDVVKAASGDNRALAPALRDLGRALAKQRKTDEALTVLGRALVIAGSAAGVRAEILVIMTDAFRAEGKLTELIAILEAEPGQDFQRLATMGRLYEETGQVDKALATYRKALAIDGRQIDTRLRLVHLLQTAGELDTAIREYEALIKAAPNNPDFVFELCETLIQRGDRAKALKLLDELERRAGHEDEILARVADFYEHVEEKERALKVMQRLAASGGGDPTHLVDLGDRYYQAGDKKRALETWAKIKALVPNRAKAAATLGEVYLDHDMAAEALASMREATTLEPDNIRYKKALAIAMERTATSAANPAQRYREAREIWEALLAAAEGDKLLARDARTHIVSLWALAKELPTRVPVLAGRFAQAPPDMDAGRLLAEVHRKLGRLGEAEATLRRIVTLAPGDEESLLALERVLVQSQNLAGAIDVLKKLASVDPKRAREFYQRMAQYAAELYRDDEAIEYAARAVELSPDDANGHQKLGDMYRRRQDTEHAVAEYRQAIAKNDRLFTVYFDLAEMLLSSGQVDEADRLFRRVVRASSDEELIARAARMSMQVNLGRGTLETLERELLPAAVGNPQKPIYRTLLVEVYGAMTFPLVQKVRHGDGAEGTAEARATLAKIGARAVKPLLDALADDKESQQKVAIEVLAYVENKSAGPALFNYAVGVGEKGLRVRAMLACGALRDPGLLTRYESVLVPKEGEGAASPGDAVAVAAAWSVARMGDRRAEPLLLKLLASPSPDVRALGAVGLGLSRQKRYGATLAALVRSPEAGATTRAAAVLALGELGDAATGATSIVTAVADASDVVLRRAALTTLARLGAKADPERRAAIEEAIAAGVFTADEDLRADAVAAATALVTGARRSKADPLAVPDGPLTLRGVLAGLHVDDSTEAERAATLAALGTVLTRAAVSAVATSPARAKVVADALLAQKDGLGLVPFTGGKTPLAPDLDRQVNDTVESLAAAVVPGFVALVRHPAIDVRTRAVELLARRPEPEAQAAVIDALEDPEEAVVRAALSTMGGKTSPATIAAVARVAAGGTSWSLRVRAVEALGRLGAADPAPSLVAALERAARTDAYALVREAAARAVAPLDPVIAAPLLRDLAARDDEPRVRKTATELLQGIR